MVYKNLFYQDRINPIGGVETVLYNIVRKYADRDITILYKEGYGEQLYRLSKYARLVQFTGQDIECERLFVNYGWHNIEGHVNAKEKFYVVHANYKYINEQMPEFPVKVPDGFNVLAVSEWAGVNSGAHKWRVSYNPVMIDDDREALFIVSATRLGKDKGNLIKRMETLADALAKRNVPFVWFVFTDSRKTFNNTNIVTVPARLDIFPYMRKADFVAQLSDTEACCMTVAEALAMGTPLLVTKIPSFYEQGCDETNSVFFDFDMSNVEEGIDRMVKHKFDFSFTPKEDIWGELLLEGARKEELIPMKKYEVKATDKWQTGGGIVCKDLGRVPYTGEVFSITEDRIKPLLGDNAYGFKFIEVIGEIEEKPKKTKKARK